MIDNSSRLPRVRACLFDMDGLLIDSEDIYTTITDTILKEYGKPNLPWSIKAQLQGRPGPESGKIFFKWSQLPITQDEFTKKQAVLQEKLFPATQPLPGVEKLLRDLESTKATDHPVHLALATSSTTRNFKLKTDHLQHFFSVFPESQQIKGDDPRIAPRRGKPLPDIYLLALESINADLRKKGEEPVKPEECLVFEDAVPGVEAGRRAGMQVVWCPHPLLLEEYRGREEEVLAGLTGEHKGDDEEISGGEKEKVNRNGKPGELNDGWGTLLRTLEDFPYERYGILKL